MHHPHDRLVRFILAEREHAISLARLVLPPAIAALVDLDRLVVKPGRQVDEKGREHIVDLALEIPFIDGGLGLFYLLIEHQSRGDRWMALRSACGATGQWREHQRDHRNAPGLPPLVTIVISHDPAGWRAATDLGELIVATDAQREAFADYMPRLRYHLVDLGGLDDAALRGAALTAAVELMIRCFQRADDPALLSAMLMERLDLVRDVWSAENGPDAFTAVLAYCVRVTAHSDYDKVIYTTLVERAPPAVRERVEMENFEEFVDKYGSHWRAHFAERIRAEGRQEGREEGRAELLSALIQQKFRLDTLPEWLEARIAAADVAELTAAGLRLLAADRLEEVMPG